MSFSTNQGSEDDPWASYGNFSSYNYGDSSAQAPAFAPFETAPQETTEPYSPFSTPAQTQPEAAQNTAVDIEPSNQFAATSPPTETMIGGADVEQRPKWNEFLDQSEEPEAQPEGNVCLKLCIFFCTASCCMFGLWLLIVFIAISLTT
ncbi:Oidioi.mRNA.OKI2018_I69.chr2.g5026.t1.cds [Oikopleura dioica]|uniref:Oidioi.mRNA.OKI2018_I69.chr2.g5026.t1.cds n=1 Tax=Oikopleura dioica TaxID=34765 RepID=A0ABN7T3H3_OIKDI|nr:Oidioi.mRNA.OKI2018_I69.chr2.g5026.t1.cds [Oikopleura dioica]